ncbi:MAG: hypothetical protein H6609_19345 [Ignavibacteriales bacterium]|nr:hypothetical protein [Ignavibacteriales bacterium]
MKGIYCLEGIWDENLSNKRSVHPILDLLKSNSNIPYIYRDVATKEEFVFFINKFKQKKYSNYSILYLAFHGEENKILASNKSEINLEDLADILSNSCRRKIIFFGSCRTLNIDKRLLKKFLKETGALAVCGYKSEVDWLVSTAFELLLIDLLQDNVFDGRGIKTIFNKAKLLGKQFSELDFRMVIE